MQTPQAGTASLLKGLRAIVGSAHLLTDPAVTASYETDWTGAYSGRTRAVVRPADAGQVAAVLRVCGSAGVPVVVQGGNTGLVGGGVPGGGEVLLSTRRLHEVGAVEPCGGGATVLVGAGATLESVQAAVRPQGWDVGVDLGSRGSATIGGMAATNAGGERVLRYGPMRAQVAGLEAVLAGGQVVGRLTRTPKDNAGYDLEQLLVGSEGTLAVLTRIRLRLVPLARRRAVALAAVPGVAAALRLLADLRGKLPDRLSSAELFLADGLALVLAATGLAAPLAAAYPAYLLVEVDDADPAAPAADLAATLADVLAGAAGVLDAAVASEPRGVAELWRYREGHTEALATAGRPVKLDVAVPLAALPGFVEAIGPYVAEVAAGVGCTTARTIVFGHLAEGNLHVNVLGLHDSAAGTAVTDAVLRRVAALGGSIGAEHGIGRAKVRWLPLSRSDAELAAMVAVKRALDPGGLLAPGVLLPAGGPGGEAV